MHKFWTLFEKNVIISGALALALVGTVCYMAAVQVPVPEFLTIAMGTVLGYFFGAGKASAAVHALKTPKE